MSHQQVQLIILYVPAAGALCPTLSIFSQDETVGPEFDDICLQQLVYSFRSD